MSKTMDPILPILSVFGYWAILLGTFGGPGIYHEAAGSPLGWRARARLVETMGPSYGTSSFKYKLPSLICRSPINSV